MARIRHLGPIGYAAKAVQDNPQVLTVIPTYTTPEQIYADIETRWPDNIARLIDPEELRSIVSGIVKYFVTYQMYKPENIVVANQSQVVINLTPDRLQFYGQIPEILFFLDDGSGVLTYTAVPWTLDAAPPNTTTITVDLGGPSNGILILK